MLAVARILRTGARLLLLDEISEGLAPVIVQKLAEMIRTLPSKGYTIVLVEQNFRFAAPLADRFYVMEHGRIVKQFAQAELRGNRPSAAGMPRRLSPADRSSRPSPLSTKETSNETQDPRRSTAPCRCRPSAPPRRRHRSGDVITIGFITDMSSLYADIDGPAGVEMIRWAVAGLRRQGAGPPDRSAVGRPPEQGRRRRLQGARMDRQARAWPC